MRTLGHDTYSIGFPDSWLDFSTVTVAGPPVGGYSPNITITRDRVEPRTSAEQYAKNQLPELQEALEEEGYRVLEEGAVNIAGIDAYQRFHAFDYTDEDDGTVTELEQWQVYVVFGQDAIIVTSTDRVDNFQKSYPTFVEAVNQFKYSGDQK